MDKHERLLEELSVVTHTGLALAHLMATIHHLRREDRKLGHALIHASAGMYSAVSVYYHLNALKETDHE